MSVSSGIFLRWIFLVFLFFGCSEVWAERGLGSIQMTGLLGVPTMTLVNPDGSEAVYSGIGLTGSGGIALFEYRHFGVHLIANAKYLDLKNTANDSVQMEVANHIGAGAGVMVDLFNFFVGYELHHMLARHYAVGPISKSTEYSYRPTTVYGGLRLEVQTLSLTFSYSKTSASLTGEAVGLNSNIPLAESVYWLGISFRPDFSIGGVFKAIFK